jgi:hypothetical protein
MVEIGVLAHPRHSNLSLVLAYSGSAARRTMGVYGDLASPRYHNLQPVFQLFVVFNGRVV